MQGHQHHRHYHLLASYLPVELLQGLITAWRCRNQMGLGRKARNQLECSCQLVVADDTEGVGTLKASSLVVSTVDQRNVCIVTHLFYPSCLCPFCHLCKGCALVVPSSRVLLHATSVSKATKATCVSLVVSAARRICSPRRSWSVRMP